MADEDQYEHYNYDEKTQKQMNSGHSGKQRSKKEAEQHTNQHDVGGERAEFSCLTKNSFLHHS